MSPGPLPPRRSALLSFRFLGTAVAGSTLMAAVSIFGPQPAQLAVLGAFVSMLGGLFLTYLDQEDERERRRAATIESLSVPLALAADPELFSLHRDLSEGLTALVRKADPILRQVALLELAAVSKQIGNLAAGRAVFAFTEGWRDVYERLLGVDGLREYRSVARVRTPTYWQDAPGRQSMRVIFHAAARGVLIERIVILADALWPADSRLPTAAIWGWIEEQHNHGLWLTLVREADLEREPDLLTDMGIYGDRAVGVHEVDDRCQTLRFVLDTDVQSVRLAEDRWRRLCLYAVSVRSLLDTDEQGR